MCYLRLNFILLCIFAFTFIHCSKQEFHFKIGIIGESSDKLDPFDASNYGISSAIDSVYDHLFITIGDGDVIPRIAKDGKRIDDYLIVTLKDDITFHNGNPLTADDIINTFQYSKQYQGNNYLNFSRFISRIDKIDPYSLKIYFYPNVPIDLSFLTETPIIQINEDTNEISGTGPYQMQRLNSTSIHLTQFDHYGQDHTGPDTIEYRMYSNTNELLRALIVNDIDFTSSLYFAVTDLKLIKDSKDYTFIPHIPSFCSMIIFNTTQPYFKSSSVRKALSLAVNRNSIVTNVLNRNGIPANTPINLPSTQNTNLKSSYNPEQSHKLLSNEGWIYDKESRRYSNEDGIPIVFDLLCEKESIFMYNTALNLRQQFKQIGIEMNVVDVERDEYFRLLNEKNFESALISFQSDMNTNSLYQFWHSDSIESGLNHLNYKNDIVDQFIQKLTIELPVDERLPVYGQLNQAFIDDPPAVFLFYREQNLIISNQYSIDIPYPKKWYYFIHQWKIHQN